VFLKMKVLNKNLIKANFKKRYTNAHKGDFGNLLVIGGNFMYSGAPSFVGLSALRAGCDIVTIAAPKRSADISASFSPDLITYPIDGKYVSENHIPVLKNLLKNKNAMVIGNGLGKESKTFSAVRKILQKNKTPSVIDADAIHAVAGKKLVQNSILTPHSGEFYALSKIKLSGNIKERVEHVKEIAFEMNCIILLKGRIDVISDGEKVFLNKTGTPWMTVGGTGDTLAGILGSFVAQGMENFDAACAASYVNGFAGELAAKQKKYLASDLVGKIPDAIGKII
jgi:ADP-dependent NAD(P)H-hydrate dehydratase / NAD(P)H-hydrate epimerase